MYSFIEYFSFLFLFLFYFASILNFFFFCFHNIFVMWIINEDVKRLFVTSSVTDRCLLRDAQQLLIGCEWMGPGEINFLDDSLFLFPFLAFSVVPFLFEILHLQEFKFSAETWYRIVKRLNKERKKMIRFYANDSFLFIYFSFIFFSFFFLFICVGPRKSHWS